MLRVETAQPFSHGGISGMLTFAMAMVLHEPVTFIKLSCSDKMTMRVCRCLAPGIGGSCVTALPVPLCGLLTLLSALPVPTIPQRTPPGQGNRAYLLSLGWWLFFRKRRMEEQGLSDMHGNGWW